MSILYEEILNRLKEILEAKSDADVARGLEISTAALSAFKRQGKFPYERLAKFCQARGISIDWLLTGVGEKKRFIVQSRFPRCDDDGDSFYVTSSGIKTAMECEILLGIQPGTLEDHLAKQKALAQPTAESNNEEPPAKDSRLTSLIEKLEYIYAEGAIKERADVGGLIEEVFHELKKKKGQA